MQKVSVFPGTRVVNINLSIFQWKTVLFNCNCHLFDTVVEQLMRVTGCSSTTAISLANLVHYTGSAEIYGGTKEECDAVADTLGRVGLVVAVTQ